MRFELVSFVLGTLCPPQWRSYFFAAPMSSCRVPPCMVSMRTVLQQDTRFGHRCAYVGGGERCGERLAAGWHQRFCSDMPRAEPPKQVALSPGSRAFMWRRIMLQVSVGGMVTLVVRLRANSAVGPLNAPP